MPRGLWIGRRPWSRCSARMAVVGVLSYWWVTFGRQIDARLHGERDRVLPRVYARPLELYKGQALGDHQLVDRLNDLGYAQRARVEKPGEFAIGRGTIVVCPARRHRKGRLVRVNLPAAGAGEAARGRRRSPASPRVGSRGRRRAGPTRHAGRAAAHRAHQHRPREAPARRACPRFRRAWSRRCWPSRTAASTTIRASTSSAPSARSSPTCAAIGLPGRRQHDHAAAGEELLPDAREVAQAQARRAVHGAHPRAQGVEGRDPRAVSQRRAISASAARSPSTASPKPRGSSSARTSPTSRWPRRPPSPASSSRRTTGRRLPRRRAAANAATSCSARWRRKSSSRQDAARRHVDEPIEVVQRALDAAGAVLRRLRRPVAGEQFPGLSQDANRVEVFTTLDPHLQRLAQDARQRRADRGRRAAGAPQAAAGGPRRRSSPSTRAPAKCWRWSAAGRTTSRSSTARSPRGGSPGSVFKPFVYLAAFEHGRGRKPHRPHAGARCVRRRRRTRCGLRRPGATRKRLDAEQLRATSTTAPITLRRALALSRNVATIKVAQQVGFNKVAALWDRAGRRHRRRARYPSITLGVFEASPLEIATAYTIFPNGGALRPLRVLSRVVADGTLTVRARPADQAHRARRHDVSRHQHDAQRDQRRHRRRRRAPTASRSMPPASPGTTNDLRDGWFVGFTPELLTVVWVGFDDNQPLGLSGTQAALPDLDDLHEPRAGRTPRSALRRPHRDRLRRDRSRHRPAGRAAVPAPVQGSFLSGTEPTTTCDVHR